MAIVGWMLSKGPHISLACFVSRKIFLAENFHFNYGDCCQIMVKTLADARHHVSDKKMTVACFKELEQAMGIRYNEHGVLFDDTLLAVVDWMSLITYD